MRIWKLCFEVDEFDNLEPVNAFTADDIQSFDGRSKLKDWKPLPVRRMEPERNLELGDAPGFTIPVFSARALNILEPLISNAAESLKLLCDDGEYYGINVTAVIDAIDYSKSEYEMYSSGNRIMAFDKYAFRVDSDIQKYNIFKIIDEPRRRAFVSDRFKETVEKNNLTGFNFRLVWDSEE